MWILVLALSACAPGQLEGDSGLPDDTGAEVPEQVVLEPTHDEDIAVIWEEACRGCHTPSVAYARLDLTDAYNQLVGVQSSQSELLRVAPGDLEASYLWHKLNDTHRSVGGSGVRMPDGGRPVLSDVRLQNIRNWVEQGAPR